ncbi:transaldolase [Dechloromonas denitrificans]|uniref:transaldolase n=1 Tax=Dechloromonas denitrificans TaxID=281362 RepID=UPI001CFBC5B4|nr:transaldolase [Dechloromonas denitrificans]UCV09514.1 transaldolase [Dechloromonas denitrificans]
MKKNPLRALKALGQHIWLDDLAPVQLRDGSLQRLIDADGIDGVTTIPATWHNAVAGSPQHADDLQRLRASGLDAEGRYESLVMPDIQAACDMLWPAYVASSGETGYLSLDVSPALAHDAAAIEAAALRLHRAVARGNLLIKVPASAAGIRAFEQLTAAGIRVNVSLIFSFAHYEAVAQAYVRGAQRWLADGGNGGQLRSVASVFLSDLDTLVDQRLEIIATPLARVLRGWTGISLAKRCYHRYLELFRGPDFVALGEAGVRPQTLLWASIGNQNPEYDELLYVEALIGPETINALPETTLSAFRLRGDALDLLADGIEKAHYHIVALSVQGVDLNEVGETLQHDALHRLAEAYAKVLASV